MGDRRRCTLYDNRNPQAEAKVCLIPHKATLEDFLILVGQKLEMKALRIYLSDGGLVDDMDLIRDNDSIYVSAGEVFCGSNKGQEKAKEKLPMYSIAIMGPGAVGKSAMTVQYVQGVFARDYDPTIEDAYRKATVVDGQNCLLDILDTAGQEDFTALRSTWMRERDGFILVFAVNARDTMDDLQSFYDQLVVMHEDRMPPIVVVGNKCDLENERKVKTADGRRLAEQFSKSSYVEASAKTGQNVDAVFSTLIREIRKRHATGKPAESTTKRSSWCVVL